MNALTITRKSGGKTSVVIQSGGVHGTLILSGSEFVSWTPRQSIPPDFDPQQEARRMKQGGCCGQPTEA